MIKLMFITNDPELARYAADCGVERLFVDLEVVGKLERQGHLDTVISRHAMADVAAVRRAVPAAELMVRLNPLHENSAAEVEASVAAGADLLMLPMFHNAAELAQFAAVVAGRAGLIPLVETPGAMDDLAQVVEVEGLREVFIGLNDLHLGLGLRFMFEPLANGLVDSMAETIRAAGLPFGFGGIARLGEGKLPAEDVLGEHLRLGSESVILSRTFHRNSAGVDALKANVDFESEIRKLREQEALLRQRSAEQIEQDRRRLQEKVAAIVAELERKAG